MFKTMVSNMKAIIHKTILSRIVRNTWKVSNKLVIDTLTYLTVLMLNAFYNSPPFA